MGSSSCLVCAFAEILLLERSLVDGQTLQQKERKKRKRKSKKKNKVVGWFIVFDFCACTSQKVLKRDSCENKDAFCLSRAVLSDLEVF